MVKSQQRKHAKSRQSAEKVTKRQYTKITDAMKKAVLAFIDEQPSENSEAICSALSEQGIRLTPQQVRRILEMHGLSRRTDRIKAKAAKEAQGCTVAVNETTDAACSQPSLEETVEQFCETPNDEAFKQEDSRQFEVTRSTAIEFVHSLSKEEFEKFKNFAVNSNSTFEVTVGCYLRKLKEDYAALWDSVVEAETRLNNLKTQWTALEELLSFK